MIEPSRSVSNEFPQSASRPMVARLCLCCGLVAGLLAGCVSPAPAETAPQIQPMWAAHSHNDYEHQHPLVDALEQGFTSVEADIYLVNGELLVGHTPFSLTPARTLEALYLDPLRERVRANHGRVYPGPGGPRPFILLIDIKTDAEKTYRVLYDRLRGYQEILSTSENGKWHAGPIMVVLSGNRPMQLVRHENLGLAGIDGRPADLDSDAPTWLIPMISNSWGSLFRWNGEGEMSPAELERLRDFVRRAHAHQRMVRFWAAPERESAWRLLLREGVDLISTDRLTELHVFVKSQPVPNKTGKR